MTSIRYPLIVLIVLLILFVLSVDSSYAAGGCASSSRSQQQVSYNYQGGPVQRWAQGEGFHPLRNGAARRQARRSNRGGLFGGRLLGGC